MEVIMPFSTNLRELRIKQEFTQTELAEKLHLSRTAISNYEKGKMQPSIETIIQISEIFNISIDKLLKQ